MEEVKLAESVKAKNKTATILLAVGVALIILGIILAIITYNTGTAYSKGYKAYNPISGDYFYRNDEYVPFKEYYDSFGEFFINRAFAKPFGYILVVGVLALIAFVYSSLLMNKSAIVVTNKRLIGYTDFGKQIDLPLSQVSSLSSFGSSGIEVSTAAGKKKFWLIANREEVYQALSKAIGDR